MKFFLFWCILPAFSLLHAQETPSPDAPSAPPAGLVETSPSDRDGDLREDLSSLSALLDTIRLRERDKERVFEQLDTAKDPARKSEHMEELRTINQELAELRHRFQSIAIKTDASLFDQAPEEKFDWQQEAANVLKPIIAEFKKATQDSRELAELNERLELNRARKRTAEKALAGLEPLLEAEPDASLIQPLRELRATWKNRLRAAENEITVVRTQLSRREEQQKSLLEQTRGAASGFVRTRGLNLLLGALAFAGVFFLMRGIETGIQKVRPTKKKGKTFSTRLASLLWNLFALVAAVGAMLAAFNATGDWFLLSLTLVFLIGVGWAGMKTLPAFIEQFRMMLNMGAVREDERLIYEGLPWKVNSIGFRTELLNPELDGGRMELPTRMLVGYLSRPPGKNEEWFPSRARDWVVLSDGLYGRVTYQTPSAVQITSPGGSQTVFPTLQYMDRAPRVLSTGFRREITFGLDYDHQADILTDIPGKMTEAVENKLREKIGDALQHLSIQLADAADSSLDLAVWVDCDGDAASRWLEIPMWVRQALVETCNREGWTIPFPQLRLHRS